MRVAVEDGDRSGVVPWLRGVDDCGIDQNMKVQIPILSPKARQGWGTQRQKSSIRHLWAQAETRSKRKSGIKEMTGKRRGEMAEAAFVAKVAKLGFGVAKPWGDSDPYDFIVDTKQILRGKRSGWFDKLTISSRDSNVTQTPQFRQEALDGKGRSLTPPQRLKLARVQVKSAHVAGADGCYSFRAHGHAQNAYRKEDIDVLVAYVVPEDAWYVFPVSVVQGVRSLKLFPGSRKKRSRFEKYREAWWVLEGTSAAKAAAAGKD